MEELPNWCASGGILPLMAKIYNWITSLFFLVGVIIILLLIIIFIKNKLKKESFLNIKARTLLAWLMGPIMIFLGALIIHFLDININSLVAWEIKGIAFILGGISTIILGKKLKVLAKENWVFLSSIIIYWVIFIFCIGFFLMGIHNDGGFSPLYPLPSNGLPGELPVWGC
ncbi:MAG: hypothetical protein WC309_01815 [Candidatus Paceibacterota bacterium]|jgi:hypothetical protein